MYELLLSQGLSGGQLEATMNRECQLLVATLLQENDWETEGEVGIYQDYDKPHLWNVYDNEPDYSRPTKWTFNALTETLQLRV